jgi:glycosyltransferase involved in cell wall biosynthesis
MRVLFLHEYPGGFGGAERYLEVLVQGLTARGVECGAVVWSAERAAGEAFVHRLGAAGAGEVDLHGGRSWPWPIVRRARAADVLHWNAVDPFAFRGGTWLLLPWGRPSVLTDHLPMLRTGPHWETTRRLVNRRVAAVIVVGEQGAAAARGHWPGLDRLEVIRNGVVLPATPATSERPAASGSTGRLLLLGRLTEQKNPSFALDVLQRLVDDGADVTLRYAGEGPLRGELEARVADAGLQDRVSFAGFVAAPADALAAADVLLAPSTFEGLPFTPLEALAAGVPAVLSDIGPHQEIAAAGTGAVIAPQGDTDAWAAAVRGLLADAPAGRERATAHAKAFSADAMVERTLAVYERVGRRP